MSSIDLRNIKKINSSFRDPAGFLYLKDGVLYRHLNEMDDYYYLMGSGLYDRLAKEKLLISHDLISGNTIKPEVIPFISYPYEWSFSMLKDAALMTLKIQEIAMGYSMILKDASAYNIQFNPNPIFIDTLSFSQYREGQAWEGYTQFCKHFLAPLVLMAYKDVRLSQLSRIFIDGIPLDLISKLIPKRKAFLHIHMNSMIQRYSHKQYKKRIEKTTIINIVKHLRKTIESMSWKPSQGWKDYDKECNYSDVATHKKAYIVEDYLKRINPDSVLDLGANVGLYSQVAVDLGIRTVAVDSDPTCVELCYLSNGEGNCLPLVMDITNPSSNIGWSNCERQSFMERMPVDCVMALAIMHHLLIGNNVPMSELAHFFGRICKDLIIEYVPKDDVQVQRLLINRNDIFSYTQESFEYEFKKSFKILEKIPIEDTLRTVYWMKKYE